MNLTPPLVHPDPDPFVLAGWLAKLYDLLGKYLDIKYQDHNPTTAEISAGTWRVVKNTSTGTLKLYANDGGTIKSVTLT